MTTHDMVIALPSLDGIKRAVELKIGVALLPRRCAITEIASGRLVALPVVGVSRRRQMTLVTASIDIDAPPKAVWDALTDCANFPRYMPKLISCRIVDKGPGWEIREHFERPEYEGRRRRERGEIDGPRLTRMVHAALEDLRDEAGKRLAANADDETRIVEILTQAVAKLRGK